MYVHCLVPTRLYVCQCLCAYYIRVRMIHFSSSLLSLPPNTHSLPPLLSLSFARFLSLSPTQSSPPPHSLSLLPPLSLSLSFLEESRGQGLETYHVEMEERDTDSRTHILISYTCNTPGWVSLKLACLACLIVPQARGMSTTSPSSTEDGLASSCVRWCILDDINSLVYSWIQKVTCLPWIYVCVFWNAQTDSYTLNKFVLDMTPEHYITIICHTTHIILPSSADDRSAYSWRIATLCISLHNTATHSATHCSTITYLWVTTSNLPRTLDCKLPMTIRTRPRLC